MRQIPTAAVAGAALVGGYAVAVASGSRPLGGAVLALGGLWCARRWQRDHGARTAITLTVVGLFAFAISHVLALAIGAWPAVLVAAAGAALPIWWRADARAASPPALPAPDIASPASATPTSPSPAAASRLPEPVRQPG